MKRYKGKYKAQLIINIDASYDDDENVYPVAEAKKRLLDIMTVGIQAFLQTSMVGKGTVEITEPSVELYEVT